MIPKIFISPSIDTRVGEIEKILHTHIPNIQTDIKSHPDVLYFISGDKLGIEQARAVKDHFSIKPYAAEGKVLVIEQAEDLTMDAQNALLKTFEEAPEKALIVLGAKSEQNLLPTILSRCEVIYVRSVIVSEAKQSLNREAIASSSPTPRNDDSSTDIERLMKSTLEERFEYVEKLKEREEFLHALVKYFEKAFRDAIVKRNGQEKELKNYLKELIEAEKWAAQNVNIRAILEYLMLIMPNL